MTIHTLRRSSSIILLVLAALYGIFEVMPGVAKQNTELRRAQLLTAAVDALDEGVIVTDSAGVVRVFSEGAVKLFRADPHSTEFPFIEKHRHLLTPEMCPVAGKPRVLDEEITRMDNTTFKGRIHIKAIPSVGKGIGYSVRVHELGKSLDITLSEHPITPAVTPQPPRQ